MFSVTYTFSQGVTEFGTSNWAMISKNYLPEWDGTTLRKYFMLVLVTNYIRSRWYSSNNVQNRKSVIAKRKKLSKNQSSYGIDDGNTL